MHFGSHFKNGGHFEIFSAKFELDDVKKIKFYVLHVQIHLKKGKYTSFWILMIILVAILKNGRHFKYFSDNFCDHLKKWRPFLNTAFEIFSANLRFRTKSIKCIYCMAKYNES